MTENPYDSPRPEPRPITPGDTRSKLAIRSVLYTHLSVIVACAMASLVDRGYVAVPAMVESVLLAAMVPAFFTWTLPLVILLIAVSSTLSFRYGVFVLTVDVMLVVVQIWVMQPMFQ